MIRPVDRVRGGLLAMRPLLLASAVLAAMPANAQTERLSVVSNGEIVGTVVGTTAGDRVTVDYRYDDNGRGPKHREEIVLGVGGIPVSWSIAGTSVMGGPVSERYAWAAGRAKWTSQADSGEVASATPGLYVVNDDSPWALGVYARAALARGGNIAALPGGRITVVKVRDTRVGGTPVTAYRLEGVELAPSYIMLDARRRLFAAFSPTGATVRAGLEKEVPGLLTLGAELEGERIRAISKAVAHRFDVPVRIRNVRLFDPAAGTLGAPSTVVVMRDRITQILPGDGGPAPADQVAIDGEGGTLMPGLADMHSHTSLASGLFNLAAGVTLTRDMGNRNDFLLDLMPRIESGEIAGPHIVPDGFIEGRSPYSARLGIIPETLDDAMRAVRWYADRGYREIKIYNSFNPDWVKPVAAEAHRLGMGVTGHVPAFSTPDRVIADGYDTIAHINQLMLGWLLEPGEDTRTPLRLTGLARAADLDLASERVQRTIRAMRENKVSLDTTAVILEQLMLSRAGTVLPGTDYYLSHLPIGYQRYRKRTFVPLKDAAEDKRYFDAFDKLLQVVRMLDDKGVRLLPSTDDDIGFTLQREIELYVKAGIAPARALRLATLGAADYLGEAGQRGSIARGKFAEFVLLPGDPLKDITAIRSPRMVMRAGAIYYPAEIYGKLGIAPFAAAPRVTLPTAKPGTTVGAPAGHFLSPDGHLHID